MEKETGTPLSEQEVAEFRKYKAQQAADTQMKENLKVYAQMVDEEIEKAIPELIALSGHIKETKKKLFENFKSIIDMKTEVLHAVKDDQRTHTFTNSKGDQRIVLGVYVTDGYRDTVEEGIAIVKEFIQSLAGENNSQAALMVKMLLKLLSRNAAGELKASRITQLRKMAEESGNGRFMQGVKIIEDAYQPSIGKNFIRAEMKNENGAWISIPLGITEA
ncbi:hypothetical protein EZS27_034282 [termite gut metagenome]|uniref:DUF3164 family protein n=1 Tax=termite gut metagenome TaxID=433724 RepID=A0A5J4Q2S7_9ZZZZ